MKKVKVEKDLPGLEIGQIIDVSPNTCWAVISGVPITIEEMVDTDFLSWVEEEKTLEEKFADKYPYAAPGKYLEELAQLAKEHYLEVFSAARAAGSLYPDGFVGLSSGNISESLDKVRKVLEEA